MKTSSDKIEPSGLSEAEAAQRLQQHGYNELPFSKSRSILATAWNVDPRSNQNSAKAS